MVLLYIQHTISFLIGQKSTVNFWNQCLGCLLPADYTIIMSWVLKIMGNHVMYDCSAWLLRVIMSSLHPLCCVPSVNKQKHDIQGYFIYWARHRKNSQRQGRWRWQRSCLLITWKRKNWENLRKRKSWHKLWKHLTSKRKRKNLLNV